MTVHFVTTGMSLRTHSRCWTVAGAFAASTVDIKPNDDLTMDEASALEGLRRVVFDRLDPANPSGNADRICRDHFRRDTWHHNKGHLLSAELNTLAKMVHAGHIQPGDEIHLLQGSADVEVRGASNQQVCALLFGLLQQERQPGGHLTGVTVDSSGPYQWDPMNERVFLQAMKSLWARICNTACEVPISLVLTGGYKAVLIDLAMHLGKFQRKTALHYVYDSNEAQLVSMQVDSGTIEEMTVTTF